MAERSERTGAPGVYQVGARLEQITRDAVVDGIAATEVTVISATWTGTNCLVVVYRTPEGRLDEAVLTRDHEPGLRVRGAGAAHAFDADPDVWKLGAEALRIEMAGRYDPMLAVSSSDVRPLPHQIRAVYDELIPRSPLRYLLADDPGAGKTIMAGLYIKELMLRGDIERCLVVAPGSLVEQWLEELYTKFGLEFELLTRDMVVSAVDGNPFARHPLLVARMDQLSRSDELRAAIAESDFDLVVVDEAHRMSASYFTGELKKTKRYELGEQLGSVARHFLLMTATPHAGREENFQLFLALLDADRFEGRYRDGVHQIDTQGVMCRRIKEELLTLEGKPLFPPRVAETVTYELSDAEKALYEAVTDYVREEMNRADKLAREGEGRRSNTVGFALTVLQRRLASSPEAIYRSLERRRKRLERELLRLRSEGERDHSLEERLAALLGRRQELADEVLDDLTPDERETVEEDVADAATAAANADELRYEIRVLTDLEELARQVRYRDTDRKWTELRTLLVDNEITHDEAGRLRKIIVFTEHRDTLNYLVGKIRDLLGSDEAVALIHGGMGRDERRKQQELFTQDKDVLVLVATDAAGEGLNLQRAHLMVNYDLPWNPNRIEQRFGRIHRIGQEEVCYLWNLVATNTREGMVFQRLLTKIEEQRRAYEGRLFDVLGKSFEETPLRDLLLQAIREGEKPEVRARLDEIIDAEVSKGLDALLAERALARTPLDSGDMEELRIRLEEARARRLQPHYVRAFFVAAFERLGGRIVERERGRYEITRVPESVRAYDRQAGAGGIVLRRYERVTFEPEHVAVFGHPRAALLAPGHPLLDAVVRQTVALHRAALKQGAVLVDPNDPGESPRLLVALTQAVKNAQEPPRVVSQRFEFVEIGPDRRARAAGPAPYLDYEAPDVALDAVVRSVLDQPWLASGLEETARAWALEHRVPEHRRDVDARVLPEIHRIRGIVHHRMTAAINEWDSKHADLLAREQSGRKTKLPADQAFRRARELEQRLTRRMEQLDREARLQSMVPRVSGGALVIPRGLIDRVLGARTEAVATYARETAAVERRAVDAVLAAEAALGRRATELPHNHPGYDVRSLAPDGEVVFIEVKGRIAGAADVVVTRNEILIGKNNGPKHRLALVCVDPDDPARDEVRYLPDPFRDQPDPGFAMTRVTYDWRKLWDRGGVPV